MIRKGNSAQRRAWAHRVGVLVSLAALFASLGCARQNPEEARVKGTIMRYNQLVSEAYRKQDMNPLQEVTTHEQAEKLYHHMAAIGEGRLRMDSTLKGVEFLKVAFPKEDEAAVETRETWDFTHVQMESGKKFAEEKDFIYEMGYLLKKENGRWIVQNVNATSGRSTNTVIPWPEVDRQGGKKPSTTKPEEAKPAGHP